MDNNKLFDWLAPPSCSLIELGLVGSNDIAAVHDTGMRDIP